MVGYGGSSAGSYLADPTSPIPSHCASIVTTSTLRVNRVLQKYMDLNKMVFSIKDVYRVVCEGCLDYYGGNLVLHLCVLCVIFVL